jgi:DNA processing protein
MPLVHYLQLALTDGLGPITIGRLIDAFGSAENAVASSAGELRDVEGIGAAKAQKIHSSLRSSAAAAEAELAKARGLGVQLLCPGDRAYPLLLRSIPDPAPVLYVKGTLEPRDLNAFALVGSRRCSYYGREQAERFAALLAAAGFTVVSGGARGVDSASHRGAMQHPHGRTIAVLGCGVDQVYPPENKELFEQIAARGAVISEYPLGTPPLAENFPRRNRIVSGISRGVLVIEADEKSGALITARQAADDHNRPVFALPGRVDNQLSAGPHKLIRDGAILTANLDDIVQNLHPLPQEALEGIESGDGGSRMEDGVKTQDLALSIRDSAPYLTDRQSQILTLMGSDPVNIDLLIDRSELSAQEILQEMTLLTLRGQVKRVDGQTFVRHNFIKS